MTTRRTRNYKEKNSMLAFGHVALPLAAVIAVGLLFMGIQLFFLAPPKDNAVEITPQSVGVEPPSSSAANTIPERPGATVAQTNPVYQPQKPDTSQAQVKKPDSSTPPATVTPPKKEEPVVLANPVNPGSTYSSQPAAPASTKQKQQTGSGSGSGTKRGSSAPASQQKPAASGAGSGGAKFGVQIGAFSARDGAESVVKDVSKQGYKAKISSVESSGKTFHRVRVLAGNSRPEAERMAKELEKKGFPVLVVQNP